MPNKWKGGKREAVKRYREKNKDEINRRNREWYHRNRERELAKRREYLEENRERIYLQNALWQRNQRQRLFLQVVAKYGGECTCCGERQILFLEIHHPDGDGKQDRKQTGGNTLTFYKWIVDNNYPKKYQLLCASCHKGIHRSEKGICPHKLARSQL